MLPLTSISVVSLAVNLPGPAAAARLRDFGADVLKIEPPSGDPMSHIGIGWYEDFVRGMRIETLDLKAPDGRETLAARLAEADLLLTANRPAALDRLGLDWETLHARFPRLCHVGIVGYPPPRENEAGHDLTYQAGLGLLNPPEMPKVLLADLAGAERATQQALALLLARERGGEAGQAWVALSEGAEYFAACLRRGVTTPEGILGGGLPNYKIYPARAGYLAVAALEPHFLQRMLVELGDPEPNEQALGAVFLTRTAREWEDWARARDLPLEAVRESPAGA